VIVFISDFVLKTLVSSKSTARSVSRTISASGAIASSIAWD